MPDRQAYCIECGKPTLLTNQKYCSACGHNLGLDAPADPNPAKVPRPGSFTAELGVGTGAVGVITGVMNFLVQLTWLIAAIATPGYVWWFLKGGFQDWGYLGAALLSGCLSYSAYRGAMKIEERREGKTA
jgi:hypothetical protein